MLRGAEENNLEASLKIVSAFEFGGFGGHGGNGFGGNGGGGDHIDGGFAGAHMSGGDFHAAQSGGNCWNSLFPTNPAWRQRHAGDKTC
jgi:hypothetical protein